MTKCGIILNITIKKTTAESPFSNGFCEHHNPVSEDALLKVPQ